MQLEFSWQIFEKYWDCEFYGPPSRDPYCSMRTDGRTDMKAIVAFHNFTNPPRQIRWASFRTSFFMTRCLKVWEQGLYVGNCWRTTRTWFSFFLLWKGYERKFRNVWKSTCSWTYWGFFFKMRIEILHTIHSVSQSDHAPGLGYSSRSDPYYPVPPQVRGFELSVEIMWRYCLYPFSEPENPLEVSLDPSYSGSKIICVSLEWSRVILRYVRYDVR
jgi:hypothetical protein